MMITHDNERHRFELDKDGHVAYIEYSPVAGGMNLIHTVVPEAIGGQGIGSMLAGHVLDYARMKHLRVVPTCSFIRNYIRNHPEYRELAE